MKLLLACHDAIAEQMAGPGIRYWELAHVLARRGHEVLLTAPVMQRTSPHVRCVAEGDLPLSAQLRGCDAVLTQWVTPPELLAVQRAGVPLVIDAYDPIQLEALETSRSSAPPLRRARQRSLQGVQSLALLSADALVCASERQRDLWLGALMALGRLTPELYDEDVTLRQFLDVVPFGCPTEPPQRSGPGPRAEFGLAEDDVVMLWGGGIWDWFDPEVVLRALAGAVEQAPQLKLVFMGVQHPHSSSSRSEAAQRADLLVDELGLRGRSVHHAYGWVPYAQRQSYLLDADAGVCAHLDHLETRFSFRTRVLDCFWAGLPCLLTAGDTMGDLVAERGAGTTMAAGDVEGWQRAMLDLAADPARRRAQGEASSALGRELTWDVIADRLEGVLSRVALRAPGRLSPGQGRELARYTGHGAAALLRDQGAGEVLRRVRARRVY